MILFLLIYDQLRFRKSFTNFDNNMYKNRVLKNAHKLPLSLSAFLFQRHRVP